MFSKNLLNSTNGLAFKNMNAVGRGVCYHFIRSMMGVIDMIQK